MPFTNELKTFWQALENELFEDILPFHIAHMIDVEQGGFYGAIRNDLEISHAADKGVIQCSRILWTYAHAYGLFGLEAHLQLARYAYAYLIEYFWDPQHGGLYWFLGCDGVPKDTGKLIYAQVYGIYALAEYYRSCGVVASLETAKKLWVSEISQGKAQIWGCGGCETPATPPNLGTSTQSLKEPKLFYLIEEYAALNESGGYIDACKRDFQLDLSRNVDTIDFSAAFSMNTHLHLLEAYANLLLVWPDQRLRGQLRKLIMLHIERIYDAQNHHLLLHFGAEWQPLNDLISYGHDIEASWLLWEASGLLEDPSLLARVRPVTLKLAETVLYESFDHQAGGIFDERHPGNDVEDRKGWWAQAEALIGFFNAYQISGDEAYLDAVLQT